MRSEEEKEAMTKEGFLGQCHPLCQILIGKTRGRRDLAWHTPLRHQHGCYNLIGCSPKRSMKIPCTRNRSNRPHGKAPTIGPPSSHSDVSPASWFFLLVFCAMLRLGMRDTRRSTMHCFLWRRPLSLAGK